MKLFDNKAKSTPQGTLTLILVVMVIMMGVVAYGAFFKPNTASLLGGDTGAGISGTNANPVIIQTKNLFGDDNKGTYRPAIISKYNTESTQYLGATLRVYKLVGGAEVYYGTVATNLGGTQTSGAVLTVEGYDSDGNVQQYVTYAVVNASKSNTNATVGSGGYHMSGRWTWSAAEDVTPEYTLSNTSNLEFKVYDEDNRAYVEANGNYNETGVLVTGEQKAGALAPSSMHFGAYNNNDTGLIVGTGGFFTYTIYAETNASKTSGTSMRFGDQRMLLAIDGQDLSDWQEPVVSIDGATVTKLSSGQYNDKIKNDGYDWIYEVVKTDGTPYQIDNQFTKIHLSMYAKAGVNPSDDVKLELLSAGYYKQTTGSAMLMDTHQDDASQTIVYPSQNITLRIN